MAARCENCQAPPASAVGLADQLHETLRSGGLIAYPNEVESTIQRLQLSYVESARVLVVMTSEVLGFLRERDTIEHVYVYGEVDMSQFSDFAAHHLPKFQSLTVRHSPIRNFRLESTTLKKLVLCGPVITDDSWDIVCPFLTELDVQHHEAPAEKFQQSLINCPRIETFFGYKLRMLNEEPLPVFYLPNCKRFTLRKGDSTESLKLYLPKVRDVNFDGYYNLQGLSLTKRGHPAHRAWNLINTAPPSKFQVSLTNAIVSRSVRQTLRNSGRVSNPEEIDRDSRDSQDVSL